MEAPTTATTRDTKRLVQIGAYLIAIMVQKAHYERERIQRLNRQ